VAVGGGEQSCEYVIVFVIATDVYGCGDERDMLMRRRMAAHMGDASKEKMLVPPDDCPMRVTRELSPPNDAALS
jgi:hypothetical protein